MSLRCIHCNIHRDYYGTWENASRQNCMVSDSGYHDFQLLACCCWWNFRKKRKHKLLEHRRKKRPATI